MTADRPGPELLAAPDKFRGTATARQVSAAIAHGAAPFGWSVRELPLADGGEGLLEVLGVLGGEHVNVRVHGPLGVPVVAEVLRVGPVAIVEMAQASGLALAGGAEHNDPVGASSQGTGELLVVAARLPSVRTVVVGLGGSATTDGGVGALEAVEAGGGLGGVDVVGACDVTAGFVEAAAQFGPQKGATDEQVELLTGRLERVARRYEADYGVDVRHVPGTGAAGGMGGAIVVLGGRLRSGYEVVGELLGLREALGACRLVVTGEGALDSSSLTGKVVGSVLRDAADLSVQALVIAGRVAPEARAAVSGLGATVVSLTERFGIERSMTDTNRCVAEAVGDYLASPGAPVPGRA
ncbi:MAG: glycerate kinase [Acidimicrobiales bacterium]